MPAADSTQAPLDADYDSLHLAMAPDAGTMELAANQAAGFAMTNGRNNAGNQQARLSHSGKVGSFKALDVAPDFGPSKTGIEAKDLKDHNSRIYHNEHFNHGVFFVGNSAPATGFAHKETGIVALPTGNLKALPTGNLNANGDALKVQFTGVMNQGGAATGLPPVSVGTPMPKWPAGHQSAAFEALAPKKSLVLSPAEIYAECAHHGEEKSKFPWYKIWALSILAGCYVGFGYTTCLIVGGNLSYAPAVAAAHGEDANVGLFKLIYGAFGFPFGFTTIVICGGELYTSLCAYMTAAWWEGKVSVLDTIRMLTISWTGNFLGCALMASLIKASTIFDHYDYTLKAVVKDKISHPWGATLVKGIFANWLVAIATWMANAAQDLSGKFVGIWLPISAFAALAFEHCVANQFVFVLGWYQGCNVTAKQFIWHNLIPATLGNYIGGAVCMATAYAFCFGRTPKLIGKFYDENIGPKMPWAAKKNN